MQETILNSNIENRLLQTENLCYTDTSVCNRQRKVGLSDTRFADDTEGKIIAVLF